MTRIFIWEASDTHLNILSHRTLLPLQYPPHTLALGGLYVACLLTSFEQQPSSDDQLIAEELVKRLKQGGDWERKFQSQVEDLEGEQKSHVYIPLINRPIEIAHTLLDLIIQFVQNPSASTSPSTPSSPSPHLTRHPSQHPHANQAQSPYNADQLIRLKIALRETERPPRQRPSLGMIDANYINLWFRDDPNLGRNEGTVRFLFTPQGAGGPIIP